VNGKARPVACRASGNGVIGDSRRVRRPVVDDDDLVFGRVEVLAKQMIEAAGDELGPLVRRHDDGNTNHVSRFLLLIGAARKAVATDRRQRGVERSADEHAPGIRGYNASRSRATRHHVNNRCARRRPRRPYALAAAGSISVSASACASPAGSFGSTSLPVQQVFAAHGARQTRVDVDNANSRRP